MIFFLTDYKLRVVLKLVKVSQLEYYPVILFSLHLRNQSFNVSCLDLKPYITISETQRKSIEKSFLTSVDTEFSVCV